MHESAGDRYDAALRAGFALAHELNRDAGPVHFLAGIAEVDGPAAEALRRDAGLSLREVAAACAVPADGTMHLHVQAQEAAREWAYSRRERIQPEHLLVALLDQGAPDVREALQLVGIDAARVRRDVLRALGASEDLAPVRLPAGNPAGTLDRPALPVDELPADVWGLLCWRQEHLPLRRLRRGRDWRGLYHIESGAVWRLATRASVDEDVRYSLLRHHIDEVERRAVVAAPDVVEVRATSGGHRPVVIGSRGVYRRRRWVRVPNAFVGWPTWFKNRAVDLNAGWFRLSTLHFYRGQPQMPERHS